MLISILIIKNTIKTKNMRKLAIILLAVLPMLGMAQESQLDALFKKYSGQEGYTSVYITSYMFELFSKIAEDDDADLAKVTKGIDAIKIITVSKSKLADKFFEEVDKALSPSIYKDFMIVNDGGQEIVFKVREDDGKVSEFVLIVKDKDEPVLLFLQGDIDIARIAKMSKSMKIKGFEHLEKVEKK